MFASHHYLWRKPEFHLFPFLQDKGFRDTLLCDIFTINCSKQKGDSVTRIPMDKCILLVKCISRSVCVGCIPSKE